MDFSVDPAALRAYASQLGGDDHAAVRRAKEYVHRHGDFRLHDQGLIGFVFPFHRDLMAALDQRLGHLAEVLSTSQTELNKTADYYERTELSVASAVDATYPHVTRPAGSEDQEPPSTGSRSDDPARHLVPPGEPEDSITNGFANPLDLLNLASPSAYLNAVIEGLTQVDVFGWMTECLAGDWRALYRFGDALGNLGDCLHELGINIQQGATNLGGRWHGNAADAADVYFSDLATAAMGQKAGLYALRDSYHRAAVGAWELSNQLGNILQAVADRAILAGIAAAAGTITAESGVGALVGYGLTALLVLDMLQKINSAAVKIQVAGGVILGLFGGAMDAFLQGGDLSRVPLPAGSYDHPAV